MRGQSWSLRDGSTSCPWLTPHRGGAVSPCSTQGCSLPAARLLLWQQFPLQLLGFSLAAPGAKHNTSLPLRLPAAPAALCFQPPKAGSSASSWGSPPRVLLHPLPETSSPARRTFGAGTAPARLVPELLLPIPAGRGTLLSPSQKLFLGIFLGHSAGLACWQLCLTRWVLQFWSRGETVTGGRCPVHSSTTICWIFSSRALRSLYPLSLSSCCLCLTQKGWSIPRSHTEPSPVLPRDAPMEVTDLPWVGARRGEPGHIQSSGRSDSHL